jgi:hypothetical protein
VKKSPPKKPAKKAVKKAVRKVARKEPQAKPKSAEPHATCGARLKGKEGSCSKSAGWRTDHPGQGKCYLHGGATPIKHGRYSGIIRPDFRERIEKFEKDPDPLNLAPEVALLRAFVEDFVDRWEEIYGPDGALLAWHESFHTGEGAPKPRQLPDFSALTALVDRVGKMVERIHKMKADGTITMGTMNRISEQMGADLVAALHETGISQDQSEKLLECVERRWNSIKLDAGRSGS